MPAPTELTALSTAPTRLFCPLASYRPQRQSLAMLFRELALAVRHKVALAPMLASIASTRTLQPGANLVYWLLFGLSVAVIAARAIAQSAWLGLVGFVLLWGALLIGSVRPHEDYIRYVANRLARSVR